MATYDAYDSPIGLGEDAEDFDTPPPLVKLTGQIYPRTGR